MKNFQQSKARLESRILGRNKDIRAILLDRVLIQHEKRLVENLHNSLTGIVAVLKTIYKHPSQREHFF